MKRYSIIVGYRDYRDHPGEWEEKYDLADNQNAEQWARNTVDSFNATLRPGEFARRFISCKTRT